MLTTRQFNAAFVANTQRIRQLSGHSQPAMAEILDIANKTYAKYETRTPMPHRYISKFCKVCKVRIADLYDIRASKRGVSSTTAHAPRQREAA